MNLRTQPSSHDPQRFTLLLTLRFQLEEVPVDVGRLFVGLTGGRVCISCGGRLHSRLSPGREICNLKPIACSEEKRSSLHQSVEAADVSPGKGLVTSGQRRQTDPTCLQVATQVEISRSGESNKIYWDIAATVPLALSGEYVNEVVGEVTLQDLTAGVHAEFEATSRVLWIAGSEEAWPARMSTNHRVLRQLMVWRWLRARLRPRASVLLKDAS